MKNYLLLVTAVILLINTEAASADVVLTNDLENTGSSTLTTSPRGQGNAAAQSEPKEKTYKSDPWDRKANAAQKNQKPEKTSTDSVQNSSTTIVLGPSSDGSYKRDPWDPKPKTRKNNDKKNNSSVQSSTDKANADNKSDSAKKEEDSISFNFTPEKKNPVGTISLVAKPPVTQSSLTPLIMVQNMTLSKDAQTLVDSCNKYNYQDCIKLADALYEGKIIPEDDEKGYAIYEMLCNLNKKDTAAACTKAAKAVSEGNGVRQNKKEACALNEKACQLDDGQACDNAAKAYENGQGVPQNLKKAQEYYQKACILDNIPSCTDYTELQRLYKVK